MNNPEDFRPEYSSARRSEIVIGVLWIGVIAALSVIVAVVRVTTYRGGGLRGSARLWDIWRALGDTLPIPSPLLILLLLVALSSALWAVWLTLVTTSEMARPRRLYPPKWVLVAVIPVAIIFVTLLLWAEPRDDVTAEALLNETGIEQTMMPTECAGFLDRAAALRSGDLGAGQEERAAGSSCRFAIATMWPTRSAIRPTGVAVWATIEATGR